MIAAGRRALVLAPHTDDGEFGCGGTIARLVEAGAEVHYHAFSSASRSLPEGFPADILWRFRLASIGTEACVWTVVGLGFGALADRLLLPRPRRGRVVAVE